MISVQAPEALCDSQSLIREKYKKCTIVEVVDTATSQNLIVQVISAIVVCVK